MIRHLAYRKAIENAQTVLGIRKLRRNAEFRIKELIKKRRRYRKFLKNRLNNQVPTAKNPILEFREKMATKLNNIVKNADSTDPVLTFGTAVYEGSGRNNRLRLCMLWMFIFQDICAANQKS